MHYETQLRNFERVDFWIQNRRNKKTRPLRNSGYAVACDNVVIDMVDQAESRKVSFKVSLSAAAGVMEVGGEVHFVSCAGRHVLLRAFGRMGCNLRHKWMDRKGLGK